MINREPNLQNIPICTVEGQRVRDLFLRSNRRAIFAPYSSLADLDEIFGVFKVTRAKP